ncbi:acetyl/propionyl/methylcrotonyl-CoA carboxylase subunit alpha [Allosphingosinicella deserti]|uniref:Methylcrotonoyl-CoA carboxylase n=1 Tax=Allosphingosinicella deserti TaxID=2116704 RepID=A0A2P7QNP4_9SPHN|nr:acetyl/propionyl/methylcrotonyl-CoA carboxylase subunit alpha [Sphingomonas deserti]PSJ39587.1 methylcrotonoyl-CoA carboxylase [Sphingomonas deserti]
MIRSLLIANRGEIACRVIRTARRLGIRTVAVFSDADRHALHVREADTAVHIGASPARESYLVGEKILAAARETGAEAIHPGYGFLSENADFAQAVLDAGLIWVGPTPASIRAMGLKDAAKRLMDEAGVPTTPGYLGDDQSPARLKAESDAIGYPVLIKAVAGGGGKGMRRVNAAAEFDDMLASCKREAAASFGDDRVLIEKYIERPRHIEVQVFGDSHGNVVHLFERDCSLQRRHQKVIEEAPAPGMDEVTRTAVCGAAVKAAQAVDYVGAGTIEFIADASEGLRPDRIWFMEMNTRLQVEHPVTEEITGQDLVEWQLRVASGERLPLRQEDLRIRGHAMEARLYAEDPAHEFLPSTGRLDHFVLGRGVRIDTGVEEGDRISPYYDPMIAKLIASAPSRDEAIDRLIDTLDQLEVWPVRTNAAFLARAADDPDFRSGDVDTAFIPSRIDRLVPELGAPESVWNLAATAMLASDFGRGEEGEPWDSLQGFRLNVAPDLKVAIAHGGETRLIDAGGDPPIEGIATARGENVLVFSAGQAFAFTLPGVGGGAAGGAASDGSLVSPMPGRVLSVDTRQGDTVVKGQKLVTLEAMKMEHSLVAPFDGIVAELQVGEGEQVTEGMLLVRVDKGDA